MRIPFSRSPRQSVSETRFGLSLGARLPSVDRYGSRHALADMPKLFDLSIGLRGKESLQLNSIALADTPILAAGEDEDEERKIWPWVVGGVGVVLIIVLGSLAGVKAATKNFPSEPAN